MIESNKVRFLLIIVVIIYSIASQAQYLSYAEIEHKLEDSEKSWDSKEHYACYLNGIHPIDFDLYFFKNKVYGKLSYSNSEIVEYLEGRRNKDLIRLEAIDENDEVAGLWELIKMGNEETLTWISSDGKRAFDATIVDSHEDFDTNNLAVFNKKKKSSGFPERLYASFRNARLSLSSNTSLSFEENLLALIKPGMWQSGGANILPTKWTKIDEKKASIAEGEMAMDYQEKMVLEYYTRDEISKNYLQEVALPIIGDELFNAEMQSIFQKYLLDGSCSREAYDARFHWWDYQLIEPEFYHIDRNKMSFRIHVVNTCSPLDTMLYYFYDRRAKRFVDHRELEKLISKQVDYKAAYHLKYGPAISSEMRYYFLLSDENLLIHQEFDPVHGDYPLTIPVEIDLK